MRDTSASVCPVPEEQQPLNEYQQLKESWFFSCCTGTRKTYLTALAWVWGLSWLISGPLAAGSFPPKKYLAHFILTGSAGACFFLVLVLLRLFLGWSYIRGRLANPTVFYEESGWYDGQSWQKTPEILLQDRLVVTHQVEPILQRLKGTFAVLAVLVLAGALSWNLW